MTEQPKTTENQHEGGFIIPGALYDTLKWVAMILLPALAVFYPNVANVWGLPLGQEISSTLVAINLLLGTLLGLSSVNYHRQQE